MPISARQLAANRRNAALGGPKTEAGREAVRMNALRHGLRAQTVVLPYEDIEDFHELRNNFIRDYAPADSTELSLVDQLAQSLWRLHRMRRVETGMLDNQLRTMKRKLEVDDSPGGKHENINNDEGLAVWLQTTPHDDMRNYFRYEGNIERNYYRALHELRDAQAARRTRERRDGIQPISAESAAESSNDMVLPEEAVASLTEQHTQTRLALASRSKKPSAPPKKSQASAPRQVSDSGNGTVRQRQGRPERARLPLRPPLKSGRPGLVKLSDPDNVIPSENVK